MAMIEVSVPDIGDFKEVEIIEVMVKPGDSIKLEQSLITVESDKASMEIPSSHAGVVKDVRVKVGDKVSQGSVVVLLDAAAAAHAVVREDTPTGMPGVVVAAPVPTEHIAPTAALPAMAPEPAAGALPHASPSIRKLARELGVPLAEVRGSGPKGRITQGDVEGFVKGVMGGSVQTGAQKANAPAAAGGAFPGLLPWPQVDFAKFGPIERRDLSRIKKISGANLHRNWVVIPHVTNHDDADITELEAFRVQTNKESEKSGIKVTMLAFLIKASVAALKKFPEFNASIDGEQLVLKQYFHIGFAADTPNGLMVPVIKDADKQGHLPDLAGDGRTRQEGARGQAVAGRDERRLLLDQFARRHRRALLHADHQCAGSSDPGRLQGRHRAALGRQGVRAEADPASFALVGPPRHRRRFGGAVQCLSRADPGGLPSRLAVRDRTMAQIDIRVPDIGDFKDVAIIELLVKPGDSVKAEQSLITVESDKASMEIPSSHAGVVKELKVKLGDSVNEGTVILTLEAEGAAAAATTVPPRCHDRSCRRRAGGRLAGAGRLHLRRQSPTSNATCSCLAPARAATRQRSAPPTSA